MTSSIEYWRRREEEQLRRNITEEAEYEKQVRKIYDRMMADIQKEIDAFYGKYAEKEGISMAAAKRRVAQLDIDAYAAKAKKYVAEKNLSKRANEEMRIYNLTMKVNRLEMLKAEIGIHLVDGFTDLDQYVSETLSGRTTDELKRQAGILGKTVSGNDTLVHSIVNASFHNATFSDRIWMHQALLKSELDKQLQQGLIAGKHPQVLARDIRKAFNVSRSDAERLMRTELARVQTDEQMRSFEENGFEWYMFLSLGSRACEVCRALNGKKFKVKDMLISENAPPMHPNCRCSTAGYVDREAYDKWIDSGAAKNDVSFKDFEYLHTAGSSSVTFESGYATRSKKNEAEIAQAHWLVDTFGGKILLLTRSLSEPTPDYKWNGKYWDLKTPQSVNGSDKLVHHGLHQINKCPGGILVDCSNAIDTQRVIEIVKARLRRSGKNKDIRIIVKDGKEVVAILK